MNRNWPDADPEAAAPVLPNHPTLPGPRVLGHVRCRRCERLAEVRYAYSNSNAVIGLQDHEQAVGVRCQDAGRALIRDGRWLKGAGYNPAEVVWEVSTAFQIQVGD